MGWPYERLYGQAGDPTKAVFLTYLGSPTLHVNSWLPYRTVERVSWKKALAPPPLFLKKRLLWRVSLPPFHRRVTRRVSPLGKNNVPRCCQQAFSRGWRRLGGGGGRGTPSVIVWQMKKNYIFTWTISPVSSETRFTDAIIVFRGINATCILMAIMAAAVAFIDIWSASNRRKTRKK